MPHLMNISAWKPIVAGVAFTAIAMLAVLQAAEPVAAKPKKESCQEKHGSCVRRCIERYPTTEEAFRCESRTCDHQFDNCVKDMEKDKDGSASMIGGGRRPPVLAFPPAPKPTIGPRGPFSADILGHSPVFGGQGPAGMGSPASAPAPAAPPPAPPPVIIR